MKIFDILTSPWAIIPDNLLEIQEIYATHLRGEKIDIKAVEAAIGKPLDNEQKPYEVHNNIAVIPVQGVIAKRMNLFSQISGGVSTQKLGNDLMEAIRDPDIDAILLDVDSPGGTVDGTEDAANLILAARHKKPIVAWTDGMMASAAYWIGSAAEKVYISGKTPTVGSIGVVATHVDYSEYEKRQGIKTTEVYAGKYKRIASEHKPLSKEGLKSIQDRVDYFYSLFVDAVAENRDVSAETVQSGMADGQLFIGQQAINAGLVDGVSTFDDLLNTRIPSMVEEREADQELLTFERSLP
jgi:signal peptide peptidase SppA